MSIATLDRERVGAESGYYWQDEDEDEDELLSGQGTSSGQNVAPIPTVPTSDAEPALAADWNYEDPVDELLEVLTSTGRATEAEVIRRVLHEDTLEEDLGIRMLVSAKWAEDWNSPEDSVYDES
jgi:hypothetical protein